MYISQSDRTKRTEARVKYVRSREGKNLVGNGEPSRNGGLFAPFHSLFPRRQNSSPLRSFLPSFVPSFVPSFLRGKLLLPSLLSLYSHPNTLPTLTPTTTLSSSLLYSHTPKSSHYTTYNNRIHYEYATSTPQHGHQRSPRPDSHQPWPNLHLRPPLPDKLQHQHSCQRLAYLTTSGLRDRPATRPVSPDSSSQGAAVCSRRAASDRATEQTADFHRVDHQRPVAYYPSSQRSRFARLVE